MLDQMGRTAACAHFQSTSPDDVLAGSFSGLRRTQVSVPQVSWPSYSPFWSSGVLLRRISWPKLQVAIQLTTCMISMTAYYFAVFKGPGFVTDYLSPVELEASIPESGETNVSILHSDQRRRTTFGSPSKHWSIPSRLHPFSRASRLDEVQRLLGWEEMVFTPLYNMRPLRDPNGPSLP